MSPLDQRTEARLEAPAPASAVNASAEPPGTAPWPEIDGSLLEGDPSQARRLPVPAFPLALLGEPWRDWVSDAARSAGAPVDYVAQALLASVAGLSGRRVMVIPTPGWQEPLRLWLAAVGAPSTGKSPALASVSRLLWTLENDETSDGTRPPRQIVLRDDGSFERIAGALVRDPRGMVLWRDGPAGCLAPLGRGHTLRHLEHLAPSILGTIEPDDLGKSRSQFRSAAACGRRRPRLQPCSTTSPCVPISMSSAPAIGSSGPSSDNSISISASSAAVTLGNRGSRLHAATAQRATTCPIASLASM